MITEDYIRLNKTETFKKGDKVLMYNCIEAESSNAEKIWTCRTDSFKTFHGYDCVFLENYGGYFYVQFLKKSEI